MRKSQISFGGKFEFRSWYNCTTKVTKSTRITVPHKNNPNFMSSKTFLHSLKLFLFHDKQFFEFPILNSDFHEFYNQLSNFSDKTKTIIQDLSRLVKNLPKIRKTIWWAALKKSLVFYFFPIVNFWTLEYMWPLNFEQEVGFKKLWNSTIPWLNLLSIIG